MLKRFETLKGKTIPYETLAETLAEEGFNEVVAYPQRWIDKYLRIFMPWYKAILVFKNSVGLEIVVYGLLKSVAGVWHIYIEDIKIPETIS